MAWYLMIRTRDESKDHKIWVGNDESQAIRALDTANRQIGRNKGFVTIADRVVVNAGDVTSLSIKESAF
jgi:hypothetical protein